MDGRLWSEAIPMVSWTQSVHYEPQVWAMGQWSLPTQARQEQFSRSARPHGNNGHFRGFKKEAPVTMAEVLASVKSLYVDELKTFGRMLLKRLRERAAAKKAEMEGLPADAVDPASMTQINPKQVRFICEACERLRVMPEGAKEYSVTLVGQPDTSLDICSPVDNYSAEFWQEVSEYFSNLDKKDMAFPGTRYACAQELMRRKPAFLFGLSLGQVCHVVQLSMTQKQILGTLGSAIVPYRHTVAQEKQLPFASWDQATRCLQELLRPKLGGKQNVVQLSNVRYLFRTYFQLELNESLLGHDNLFNLLNDERLRGVCIVRLEGDGQFALRPAVCDSPQAMWIVPMVPMTGYGQVSVNDEVAAAYCGVHSVHTDHISTPPSGDKNSPESTTEDESGKNSPESMTEDCSSAQSMSSMSEADGDQKVSRDAFGFSVKNTFIDVPTQEAARRSSRRARSHSPNSRLPGGDCNSSPSLQFSY